MASMYDRLSLLKAILGETGNTFISIDDFEIYNLGKLVEIVFGNKSIYSTMIWKKQDSPNEKANAIATYHEYVLCVSPDDPNRKNLNQLFKKEIYEDYPKIDENGKRYRLRQLRKNGKAARRQNRPNLYYSLTAPDGSEVFPIAPEGWEGRWVKKKETFMDLVDKNQTTWVKRKYGWVPYYYEYAPDEPYVPYPSLIDDANESSLIDDADESPSTDNINQSSVIDDVDQNRQGKAEYTSIMGSIPFDTPKPTSLIKKLINISLDSKDTVLDFFAGSGTTGHAVLKLNKGDKGSRKFILVEMGQYFEILTKPRILKVIYSDNWKDGKPQDNKGSEKQIIKYQILEQYEDSLNNIDFKEPNTLAKESKDYKIKYMLEFETKGSNVLLNIDALDNPFEYKLKIENDNQFKECNIDLIETFNYIAGIDVTNIQKKQDDKTDYIIVKGQRDEKDVIVIWRNKSDGFDPIRDKEFVQNEITIEDFDEIFVNGNSLIPDAKSVDEIFKSHMFRGYNG
jgi:adenine-specific DNA-methyltransferase